MKRKLALVILLVGVLVATVDINVNKNTDNFHGVKSELKDGVLKVKIGI